jgi:SAM-dependent methyltransferase
MDDAGQPGNEQRALWNGPGAEAWIEARDLLDAMFRPFEDMLAETVAADEAHRVLDIGCGTGSTTIATDRALGGTGRAVGLDISEPMIAVARDRAAEEGSAATFIAADAETHHFATSPHRPSMRSSRASA